MDNRQIIFKNHPVKSSEKLMRDFPAQVCYTNDKLTAQLVFEISDCTEAELAGLTASIMIFMKDGSFFQDSAVIDAPNKKITYVMLENQVAHAGDARASLVLTGGSQGWGGPDRNFTVISDLGQRAATEVMIKDWTMLTAEARAYLDEFAANEVTRQQTAATAESARAQTFTTNEAGRQSTFEANEVTRQDGEDTRLTAEQGRATAETGRVNAESSRVTAEQGRTTAEQGRVNAESARVTAEQGRAAALADIENDVIDHENRILDIETIMKSVKIESWKDVQKIVRAGIADKVFTVGDQITAKYAGVDYLWDVIGIDHDVPSNPEFTHSLTIQSHDCLRNCTFDAIEPTNPDTNRALYGSNNYLESNIRQWLNDNNATFNFVAKTPYDVKPSVAPYTGAGFLYNLDPELKAVIGPVKKQVARNTLTDGGGQDLFEDKVFLLSRVEVYGGTEGVTTGESPYPYYSMLAPAATSAEMPGRIKYLSGAVRYWWLRSPFVSQSHHPRLLIASGSFSSHNASNDFGLAPACTIY